MRLSIRYGVRISGPPMWRTATAGSQGIGARKDPEQFLHLERHGSFGPVTSRATIAPSTDNER